MRTYGPLDNPITRRRLLTGAAAAAMGGTVAERVAAAAPQPATRGANCVRTSVGFTPLPDLGSDTYQGFTGGLYPNGAKQPPAAYAQTALANAARVQPRDGTGQPSADGRVVLLSIGMSNTTQEFSAFKSLAAGDPRLHPKLTIVDGAEGGQDAVTISDAHAPYWTLVENRLRQAGVSAPQVQAIWLKEAIKNPSESFPTDARRLQDALRTIVGLLRGRFPELQVIYLASRTYGGYASTPLNPEPYAYQSGFAVKWLIEEQIASPQTGPWLGWGPYLWTDGTAGRKGDGLAWTCADVRATDGTHPSESGRAKVAQLLLDFFTTDATATPWFVASTNAAGTS